MKKLLLLLITLTLSSCLFSPRSNYLRDAEEFSRQKKYPEAIQAYRKHMQQRLNLGERPEWENPYFYLILIGDIELGTGQPEDAIKSYQEAESQNVDIYLVSDRLRSVARWYEEKGQLDKALALLLTHREKDTLLFDAMLDRINKAITLSEDNKTNQTLNH